MDSSTIALLASLVAVFGGLVAVFVALNASRAAKRRDSSDASGSTVFDSGRKSDSDAGDSGGDGGGGGGD